MSYSFNVRAATLAAAVVAVAAELDKVVAAQPIHAADHSAALETAKAFIGLCAEPGDGQEVSVSVNGYVSRYDRDDDAFSGASVGVTVGLVAKQE